MVCPLFGDFSCLPCPAYVRRSIYLLTRTRTHGAHAGNKQHTFIETETVRYVYQPIENLFLLLVTNKASNIVEDLETLRMLSKGECRPLPKHSDTPHHDSIFLFVACTPLFQWHHRRLPARCFISVSLPQR